MTPEKEISNIFATELQQAIDNSLMADMLVSYGWTKVGWNFFLNRRDAVDRKNWLAENCQGHYRTLGMHIVFEDSRDATLFILKWGTV